jgi:hypothetical protein
MRHPIAAAAVLALPAAAAAQGLTPESLQGLVINSTVTSSGNFTNAKGRGPGRITATMRVTIGSDGTVQSSHVRNVVAETPKGEKTGSVTRTFSGRIGTPGNYGGGNFVWLLDGNQLVLLRTMEIGGQKITTTLTGGDTPTSCSVTAPMAQEQGAGESKTVSAFPGKVTIHDMCQTSSKCSVSRGS